MNRHISLKSYLLEQMNRWNIAEGDQQNFLRDIVAILIDNEWYGIEIIVSNVGDETELLFSDNDVSKMESNIQLFLEHYKKTIPEKVEILLQLLKIKFPLTTSILTLFYIEYDLDENEQYMINDFLLYTLDKDIHLYNNQEIDKLVQTVCEKLPLYIGKQLIYFLSWIRKKHNTNFTLDFELARRRLNANKTNAYDSDTILQMVYYLFNPSYIQENNLFIHAAKTPGVANCWIYLALHCISALRDTDIIRIPHPRLRQTPDEILQSIIDDTFDTKSAMIAVNSVLWQLKSRPITPSKTASYSNISDIKLMIPESSMELFGMMFIISESHHQRKQSESVFITPVKDYEAITRYLGEDVGNLFLENDFRARSANKAYMQAIELLSDTILKGETSDTQQPHAKGYMLAALARSHKGSYGEFCKTTEIYLKDAAFSGYKNCTSEQPISAERYMFLKSEFHSSSGDGKDFDLIMPDYTAPLNWLCKECNETFIFSMKERYFGGRDCACLEGKKAIPGKTSFKALYPELASEFSLENNIDPDSILPIRTFSRIWDCTTCGMSWNGAIKDRIDGKIDCPYCSGKKAILGKTSFKALYPKMAAECSEISEEDLDNILPTYSLPITWDCSTCAMTWKGSVKDRVEGNAICPYCSGKKAIPGITSFKALYPEMAEEYSSNNEASSDTIISTYSPQVEWDCPVCNMTWKGSVKDRVNEEIDCPYCNGREAIRGKTSFKALHSDMMKEWNLGNWLFIDPDNIIENYSGSVWWTCSECRNSYAMSPRKKLFYQKRKKKTCPYCKGLRRKMHHFL